MRALLATLLVALTACGGDRAPRPNERAASARPRSEASAPPAAPEPATEPGGEPDAPAAAAEPDFGAPLPAEACAETRVRLAHRSAAEPLPPVLTEAVALRSADGRRIRVVLADHALERNAFGRFLDPEPGHARFELDAVRSYRRALEPGVLGPPDSRRGALRHVRIVTSGPLFTFGHRGIGTVELTELGPARVCGRIDLDDGFGRVRGAFSARVIGPLPE
ncbi:MAG TPA: hypothetical protein VIL20_06425 [Sandaracinaceae bacterium]